MKKDISSREHLKLILSEFYKKLVSDSKMFPFFEEIVQNDTLEEHLEVITDFWQDLLLNTTAYRNNVLQKHLDFNKKVTFEKEHFNLWLHYLVTTIDELFEGQLAENMKNRANSIAMVMQVKFKLYD